MATVLDILGRKGGDVVTMAPDVSVLSCMVPVACPPRGVTTLLLTLFSRKIVVRSDLENPDIFRLFYL